MQTWLLVISAIVVAFQAAILWILYYQQGEIEMTKEEVIALQARIEKEATETAATFDFLRTENASIKTQLEDLRKQLDPEKQAAVDALLVSVGAVADKLDAQQVETGTVGN